MLVQVGVDGHEIMERCLVQHLEDLELQFVLEIDAGKRCRKRLDEGHRRQRIGARFESRLIEKVGDAAIERDQLIVRAVLDDAKDVPRDHRLVHYLMIDERQLAHVKLRKIGFNGLGLEPIVDASA